MRGGIFYGWWVVLASAIGLFMSYNPVVTYTFGVFLVELGAEFRWTRGQISAGYSLAMLAFAIGQPFVGRTVDRVGARRVIIPAFLVFGAAFASLSLLSPHLWHFYIVFLLIGAAGGGTTSVAYFGVLSRWFRKRRGVAMGLALAGNGLSGFVMPTLGQALVAALGWRVAYLALGLLSLAVAVPVVVWLFRESPESMGMAADGETSTESETAMPGGGGLGVSMTGREALRDPRFWLISGSFFLMSTSLIGCLTHLVPMLVDRGASAPAAALATSVLGGAALLGRIAAGLLLDRFFAPRVTLSFFAVGFVGVFLVWTGVTGAPAFVGAFLIGLAVSADTTLPYLVTRYFGLKAFGEIFGLVIAMNILGWMSGPILMGFAYDTTGSYRTVLGALLISVSAANGLIGLLARRRPELPQ